MRVILAIGCSVGNKPSANLMETALRNYTRAHPADGEEGPSAQPPRQPSQYSRVVKNLILVYSTRCRDHPIREAAFPPGSRPDA